jgi:transmembrane sensor
MRSDLDDQDEGLLISDRAAEWFVRLHDHLSAGQRRDYWRWLKKSQEHITAALETGRIHGLLREMKLPPSIVDPPTSAKVVELYPDKRNEWRTVVPEPQRSSAYPWKIAVAALIGVLASVLALVATVAWFNAATETVAGEWHERVLTDGSTVRIGPRSRVRVVFDEQRRYVELLSGDAMFEVAKDPRRPFIVDTGFGTARAVGTEFGVSRYDDRMVVTVAEGVVAVARDRGQLTRSGETANSVNRSAGATGVSLAAGEQVAVSRAQVLPVQQVDVERELAWVRGKLIFENQTIGEAIYEFNRRNRIQIEVRDHALASLPVQGVFNAADPRSFTAFLESVGTVTVTQDQPNVLRLEPSSTGESHEPLAPQADAR